jgi:hypothetical protein
MKRRVSKPVAVFFLLLLSPVMLLAQGESGKTTPTPDQIAGTYKGTAKVPAGEMDLTLEIKSENGKLSGHLVAKKTEHPFTLAELVNGKLTIKLVSAPAPVTLVLEQKDDGLVGDWKAGAEAVPVVFTRVPPANTASAADLLSGEWDAAADAQGQAFPFTLTLKVEGDKVTGSSSSSLGYSTVSSGSWKDGKLAIVLDAANGPIALIATMIDGKLVGDYDFAGQLQGKWVAIKKKP